MPRPSLSLIDPETSNGPAVPDPDSALIPQPGVKADVNKIDSDSLSVASSISVDSSGKPKVVQRLHSQVEESREDNEGVGGDDGDEGESDPEEINSEDEDEDEDGEGQIGEAQDAPEQDKEQLSAIQTQMSSDDVGTLLFSPGGTHTIASTQKSTPKPKPRQDQGGSQNQDGEKGEDSTKGRALSVDETLFDQTLKNRILKVGARIGKGASASVFRAIDSVTLKIVALKEISISEPLKCKMLQEELKALMPQRRSLDDLECGTNCIVDYYGAYIDMTSKTAYMVMEYMEDGSFEGLVDLLFKAKEADDGLKELYSKWSAKVGKDLFTGLLNFHETNRVHRDIKPANILINEKGEAKLSDFGLARSVEASVDAKATSFVGTFNFMSPERLYGNTYTKTSDIWSAGMTLFYACRGKYPLTEGLGFWELVSELEEIVAKIQQDDNLTENEKGFFGSCFQSVETRPSAEVLLRHPLMLTADLTDEEKLKIRAIIKKAKQENLALHLTTDDVNEFCLQLIRVRAGDPMFAEGKVMPTKDEMTALSRRLGVFSITVSDSFSTSKHKYDNELSTYELRGAEASKVKVITRSERRRRRTFGANARVSRETEDFDDVQLAMMGATSALNTFVESNNEANLDESESDFKTRAHHARSAPPPKSEVVGLEADDVSSITKQFNDMSKLIESEIAGNISGQGPGLTLGSEVKMISVGEARRRRRRTFDGKRPLRPDNVSPPVPFSEKIPVDVEPLRADVCDVEQLPEISGNISPSVPPILIRARTSERTKGEEEEKLRTKSMSEMLEN
ncbi:hypothetical protein TrVE_jg13453 [Triparma verrucosa]|uniref:mitogen-activated protein kinase kinase n=1 Tax=Triparma verrucosa TaxID=1606542 RepID=A0A9W7FCV5_9STRA|nr:hypothetical protein TrVE_jg13453 [Triparma verrucosa]